MKIILILLLNITLFAQSNHSVMPDKLNPELQMLLTKKEGHRTQSPSVEKSVSEKYGVIVYTDEPEKLKTNGIHINSKLSGFVTVRLTLDEIQELTFNDEVKYITTGEINEIHNDVASGLIGANLLHSGYVNSTIYKGSNVLVCIIDTGIDWDHPDFRNPTDQTKSRILAIWDQTLTPQGMESTPSAPLNYGVEYSKAQIEDELDGSPAGFVREADINGHGTHVAGTVAGNGNSGGYPGVAPEADILIVKSGNGTFTSENIINALTWAGNKAAAIGKPIVVNMSLGSVSGSHDGTDAKSVAINSFTGTGKVVVVSAGNSGGDNIHYSNTIPPGGSSSFSVSIPGYTPAPGAYNDYLSFETWFENNSSVSVTVRTPGGTEFSQAPGGQSYPVTSEGKLYLYNNIVAQNGDREIYFEIYDETSVPASGSWVVTFTNTSGSPVEYHTWLVDQSINVSWPGNTNYTLGNTASNAIIVGSYVHRWRWLASNNSGYKYNGTDYSDNISSFSSKGPTRDNIQKPDITAPGQAVISCRSSNAAFVETGIISENYVMNQGTSMSSPVVAGAVALLLQQKPDLTASRVLELITSSAETDNYTGSVPNYTWGYGKLDIYKTMVQEIQNGFDNDREVLAYDAWETTNYEQIDANEKISVKFTPGFNGKVTGVMFHPRFHSLTSPLYAEIWSDNLGSPSAKLGSTIMIDAANIARYSWNSIDMSACGVNVLSGINYHTVLYFVSGSMTMFYDDGIIDNRSSANPSGSWSNMLYDYRIRTIVAKDITALPVELVSFQAVNNKKYIVLNWETANEVNCYGFDIERKRKEDTEWMKVGFVKGSGNSNSSKKYSFKDADLKYGSYSYRLKEIDSDGRTEYSPESMVDFVSISEFALDQNYPNPFNPYTVISYQLPADCNITLKVFDVLGKEVKLLESGFKQAGSYKLEFNAQDLSTGIYFYELNAGEFIAVKKFLLQK